MPCVRDANEIARQMVARVPPVGLAERSMKGYDAISEIAVASEGTLAGVPAHCEGAQ